MPDSIKRRPRALTKPHNRDPSAAPDEMTTFEKWALSILNRERPVVWQWAPPGSSMSALRVAAGTVAVIGAPPGAGKTALAGQLLLDAMRTSGQENLRVLMANVEMSPGALLDRHLARLTGIDYCEIQSRAYDPATAPRNVAGIEELRAAVPRLAFLSPPFTLENLAESASKTRADLIVVDYAQRFDHEKRSGDQRSQANRVMEACRRLADDGRCVLVISAVNRASYGKDATLAAFRESSELEYGADSAWLLIRNGDSAAATLRCVKNRHGRLEDVKVLFDGAKQQFDDYPAEAP